MTQKINVTFPLVALILCSGLFFGCKTPTKEQHKTLALNLETTTNAAKAELPKKQLSAAFKAYWYAGDAEITSYKLEQARYGELRDGKAVLVYVTEPFLPKVQVKADRSKPNNIPVLKLNKTKKYLTGIYPYSIMSSTFYPVHDNQHALKTSLSVQEWCGHMYAQLNNRADFEFTSHSYFEGEADQNLHLDKALLEDEIWNKIRIKPADLPKGAITIIPALEYFRLQHKAVKSYQANASLSTNAGTSTYTINYTDTSRKLSIYFKEAFPYQILGWEETYTSGFGPNAKEFTSKATKINSLKTPYWSQNANKHLHLRDSLGL